MGSTGVPRVPKGSRGYRIPRGSKGSRGFQGVLESSNEFKGYQGVLGIPEGFRVSTCSKEFTGIPEVTKGSKGFHRFQRIQ